jgi:hypothetical protein
MGLRSKLSLCAHAAFLVVPAACGSSSSPAPAAPRVFIGDVTGSDARVGVVATDHSARIFFCGGAATYKGMTHWFPSAPIDAHGAVSQPADKAGWVVVGQVAEAGMSGTVTPPGMSAFAFHADPVAKDTIAGLYEATGPCGKVGLIVAQGSTGATPDGQGACVPASGNADPEQVNPIRPIERAGDGTIPVVVDGAQIPVRAAAPPAG